MFALQQRVRPCHMWSAFEQYIALVKDMSKLRHSGEWIVEQTRTSRCKRQGAERLGITCVRVRKMLQIQYFLVYDFDI
jgi:hypothetical protein